MNSWKVRLGLVLTILGMLLAVSAPTVAQTDELNDKFFNLAAEAEEECDELGDEDRDGLNNGDDEYKDNDGIHNDFDEQDCVNEAAGLAEDCVDDALDAVEDGDEADDIECGEGEEDEEEE